MGTLKGPPTGEKRMSRSMVVPVCALLAIGASLTCSPFDSGDTGSAGPDAGPVWTTGDGTDGGTADAGGQTPDAGTPPDSGVSGGGGGGGGAGGGGGTGGGGGGGPPAACDGVVPAANPPRQSATVPHSFGQVCWFFSSDEQGNVAAESHSGDDFSNVQWNFFAPGGGSPTGTARAGVDLFGEPNGFEGSHREAGSIFFMHWSGTGTELSRTLLGGAGCNGETFPSLQKGALVLGGCNGGALNATIFDADGRLLVTRAVANQLVNAVGAVDANGRVIVVVWPGSAIGLGGAAVARWFDASLNATTDWFQLPGDGQRPLVRPLIGGGAAVQSGGSWVAAVGSGQAAFGDAPAWLASHPQHDFMIVRQGRAYALIPKFGTSDPRNVLLLYDPAGNSCGAGTFPGGNALSVGHDGTVIDAKSDCTIAWWSGVLR
jgi:hypothetical protein